ncbi:MAG TPA: hypothetical protein VFD58_17175 [Blastocatellia bacterium]|nr:hypothetical protein [Blastocatellia bacterium]
MQETDAHTSRPESDARDRRLRGHVDESGYLRAVVLDLAEIEAELQRQKQPSGSDTKNPADGQVQ